MAAGKEWRSAMIATLASGDRERAADALLSLTYNEPDRSWLERMLIAQFGDDDKHVAALAATCLGHVARLRGAIDPKSVERLRELSRDCYRKALIRRVSARVQAGSSSSPSQWRSFTAWKCR